MFMIMSLRMRHVNCNQMENLLMGCFIEKCFLGENFILKARIWEGACHIIRHRSFTNPRILAILLVNNSKKSS